MRRFFLILLSVAPLAALAYTSPGAPAGFVNDFAGLMAPEMRAALEEKLASFARARPAAGGAGGNEIAVATVPTLDGDSIENFANELFDEWNIGKKGADSGVLVLVAESERQVRIEVGYGLEPVLTDARGNAIIRTSIAPRFAEGDFAGGLTAGTDAIIALLSGGAADEGAAPPYQNGGMRSFSDLTFLFLLVPLWLASILGRSKSWWAGGVVGGVAGVALGTFFGFLYFGLAAIALLVPLGLLFDFIVSRAYAQSVGRGLRPPWWVGGGRMGGGFGGGFGGFGGGSSGGGGASGGY